MSLELRQCPTLKMFLTTISVTDLAKQVLFSAWLDICAQSYLANLFKLTHWDFVLEMENPTQVLEPGLTTEAYKLTSLLQRGSESGSWKRFWLVNL